jgi:cytochrome c-type biogenesis protein
LGPFALAAGLVLSFTVVGLFVAAIGYELGLDSEWFRTLAALMLMGFGLILLSDRLQARLSTATSVLSAFGNHALSRIPLQGLGGQLCVGILLGVVWAPCVGPTLGAVSTLAAQRRDLPQAALVMVLFGLGAALPLLVLGAVSRTVLLRYRGQVLAVGKAGKMAMGVILVAFGLMIVFGLDKRLEAFLFEHSPGWLTDLTTRY